MMRACAPTAPTCTSICAAKSDPREAQNGQGQGRAQNGAGADAAQEEATPQYDYAAAAFSRGGVDTFA